MLGLMTWLRRNFSIRPICSLGIRSAVLPLGATGLPLVIS
jgi:hypothetical protein